MAGKTQVLRSHVVSLCLAIGSVKATPAQTIDDIKEEFVNDMLAEPITELCGDASTLPLDACALILGAVARNALGQETNKEELADDLKSALTKPEYLNTIVQRRYGAHAPFGITFVSLDSKQGETVLGFKYNIEYNFASHAPTVVDNEDRWDRRIDFLFIASGTVASDSYANPRNFLDTKLSLDVAYTTNIPLQSEDFGIALSNAAGDAAPLCSGPNKDSDECENAKKEFLSLLDTTTELIEAYQRYTFGLDAGYETDQSFAATQSKLSIFITGQYEAWGHRSLLGSLGLRPSARLAFDKIDPNEETPRAIAGDDSSYYRASPEVSIWLPLGTKFDQRLTFTYNYRYYAEISPSDVVKEANLDTYNLRTYSLVTPTGLFASYSSGRLPFDIQSDRVVELGWQTYF